MERRVLDDIAARFRVLGVLEVSWSEGECFSRSLTRMYGTALPPGSDKERQSGTGPFLAVVVEDTRVRYRPRRHRRRWRVVNAAVWDARARYRRWAGGGYRVHASDSVDEAERNLVLLFGRRGADFRTPAGRSGPERGRAGDPVGTHGWSDLDELLLALDVLPGGARSNEAADADLTVEVTDLWWAEKILAGAEAGEGLWAVDVAGARRLLRLRVDSLRVPTARRRWWRAWTGG